MAIVLNGSVELPVNGLRSGTIARIYIVILVESLEQVVNPFTRKVSSATFMLL